MSDRINFCPFHLGIMRFSLRRFLVRSPAICENSKRSGDIPRKDQSFVTVVRSCMACMALHVFKATLKHAVLKIYGLNIRYEFGERSISELHCEASFFQEINNSLQVGHVLFNRFQKDNDVLQDRRALISIEQSWVRYPLRVGMCPGRSLVQMACMRV